MTTRNALAAIAAFSAFMMLLCGGLVTAALVLVDFPPPSGSAPPIAWGPEVRPLPEPMEVEERDGVRIIGGVAPLALGEHLVYEFPGTAEPPRDDTRWLYLPGGTHAPGSLPLILIAPAGSDQLSGMPLAEGDRLEHTPYLDHGFAVMAYALDGHGSEEGDPNVAAFGAAKGGLLDARDALHVVKMHVPEVNFDAVFAVGHSSATGPALLAGAHLPIRGVVAFNGDGQGCWTQADVLLAAYTTVEDFEAMCNEHRPLNHVGRMTLPTFLFGVEDDAVIPVQAVRQLSEAIPGSRYEEVAEGGHYLPMLGQGVPRAITWMKTVLGEG